MVEQTIVHYATDGWLLYKGSDEAKRQLDMEKMEAEAAARFQVRTASVNHDEPQPIS
jgi:dynein intermediate chain 1, axonemal